MKRPARRSSPAPIPGVRRANRPRRGKPTRASAANASITGWPSARRPATRLTCPRPEIYAYAKELSGLTIAEFRPDLYFPIAKDSDYGVKILPPDFTFNELRAGDGLEDIYRSIAAGIGGTAMPTWKNVLPEGDLWAMAYYVRSLVAMRGSAQALMLQKMLLDQPAWSPPPPTRRRNRRQHRRRTD